MIQQGLRSFHWLWGGWDQAFPSWQQQGHVFSVQHLKYTPYLQPVPCGCSQLSLLQLCLSSRKIYGTAPCKARLSWVLHCKLLWSNLSGPFVSPGKKLTPTSWNRLVTGWLLPDGFAPVMAVPGFWKWQDLSCVGTGLCGTQREGSSGLLLLDGAFWVYQGACANCTNVPSLMAKSNLLQGCHDAAKEMGEHLEWTLIRSKFEDLQYLSLVGR